MTLESTVAQIAAPITPAAMLLDTSVLDKIDYLAEIMSSGRATVPQHLRGNKSDCFAIVMQAFRWGMDPFAVAQKTHITQGGALGYEAQLIAAVIAALAPIEGRPEYEFIGDWTKVLGKVTEATGKNGGSYFKAAYTKQDEDGLGVIVRATFINESNPRELTCMMSQAYPRFSTQWATDPAQQIGYLAIRKWGRRYTPDVILGVYTPEEQMEQGERDMGRAEVVAPASDARRTDTVRSKLAAKAAPKQPQRPALPNIETIILNINSAKNQQELAHAIEPVTKLASEEDKTRAREAYAAKLKTEKARSQTQTDSAVGFAQIIEQMKAAKTVEDLDLAVDLARDIDDMQQRADISELYSERRALMEQ